MKTTPEVNQLQALLRPRSVAVIGASTSPDKLGHEILKNIVDSGFPGAVYPVNPKADTILGLNCYAAVKDIPSPPDLAVIIIPARFVPATISECGSAGVKGAVIITGGFAEAGAEGEALQAELVEAAAAAGVRVIGPNCQGINNPYLPICASWPLLTAKGKVAVISQSGTVGAAMMDWFSQEHLGVSGFVSMGNRADVDESDLISFFNTDDNTEVIAAYIEGVKRPRAFAAALDNLTKPLVVLKSGRTPRGKVAAESHTKALAGADAVYDALLSRPRVCRAYTSEEFYDYAKAFAYLKPPAGNRILFVTTSGGAGILAVDQAEQEGLEVSPLPAELAAAIAPHVPAHAIRGNPVDLTGDATAAMFAKVIEICRQHYDTIGVIFGDPVAGAADVVTPGSNELVIFLGGAAVERQEREAMHRKGVPVFPTPERGIKALARLFGPKPPAPPRPPTLTVAASGRQLSPHLALQRMAAAGLPVAPCDLARSSAEAAEMATRFGFPVVLKIDSPDILHKSDVGGVRLHLNSAAAVEAAYEEIVAGARQANPQARINGVLVSRQAEPGLEVIVGMNRDPQFGPVILFGLGGVMVEIFRDVSLRLLPIDEEGATEMIKSIKGYPLLAGYRGAPPVDEKALVDCILSVAAIAAAEPEYVEIDLNPVLAYPEGICVVDARILTAGSNA